MSKGLDIWYTDSKGSLDYLINFWASHLQLLAILYIETLVASNELVVDLLATLGEERLVRVLLLRLSCVRPILSFSLPLGVGFGCSLLL